MRAEPYCSLGAGRHVARLGRGRRIAAGVYWLRLSQAGQAVSAKVVVVP